MASRQQNLLKCLIWVKCCCGVKETVRSVLFLDHQKEGNSTIEITKMGAGRWRYR